MGGVLAYFFGQDPTDVDAGATAGGVEGPAPLTPPLFTMRRWAVNVARWNPESTQWLKAAATIQPEEKERIGRFVFAVDAKLAMGGRLLIRRAVCDVVGVDNRDVVLTRSKERKPFLKEPRSSEFPLFNFNVSHAGDYVMLVSSPSHIIGVDVADIRRPNSQSVDEFFRLMKRQFTPAEWVSIKQPANELDRLHMFYRHWSLKESYIKAVGVGLALDLQRLEFSSDPTLTTDSAAAMCTEATLRIDGHLDTTWKFAQCYLDAEHCVAVALGPPPNGISDYLSTIGIKPPEAEADAPAAVGTVASSSTYRALDAQLIAQQLKKPFETLTVDELLESASAIGSVDDEPYWEQFASRIEKPSRR